MCYLHHRFSTERVNLISLKVEVDGWRLGIRWRIMRVCMGVGRRNAIGDAMDGSDKAAYILAVSRKLKGRFAFYLPSFTERLCVESKANVCRGRSAWLRQKPSA